MERITRTVKAAEIKTPEGQTLLVLPEEVANHTGAVVVGVKCFKASMSLRDFISAATVEEVK